MRGFPKKLNSKFDYEYIKEHFLEDEWKPAWKSLLSESKNWFFTGKLKCEADGLIDNNHRIETGKNMEGETEYYQYEYMIDQSSDMIQLGFTESEVIEALK